MYNLETILNLISLMIGLENLDLNQKQIDGLDSHLKNQDETLENMLKQILENQKIIIDLLKGGK